MEALRLRVDLDKAILEFELENIKIRLEKLGYRKVSYLDIPKFKSLTTQIDINQVWFDIQLANIDRVLRKEEPVECVLKPDIQEKKALDLGQLRELSFNNYRSNMESIRLLKRKIDSIDIPDVPDIIDRCVKKELPEPYCNRSQSSQRPLQSHGI